jgi:hypothetical protein
LVLVGELLTLEGECMVGVTSSVGDGPDGQDSHVGERGKGEGSTARPGHELDWPNAGERGEERGWLLLWWAEGEGRERKSP